MIASANLSPPMSALRIRFRSFSVLKVTILLSYTVAAPASPQSTVPMTAQPGRQRNPSANLARWTPPALRWSIKYTGAAPKLLLWFMPVATTMSTTVTTIPEAGLAQSIFPALCPAVKRIRHRRFPRTEVDQPLCMLPGTKLPGPIFLETRLSIANRVPTTPGRMNTLKFIIRTSKDRPLLPRLLIVSTSFSRLLTLNKS